MVATFGTGITSFALEFPVGRKNLERVLTKIDQLKIPEENGRVIEYVVAHGIGGFDLDHPEENGTFELAKHIGEQTRARGYHVIIVGFHAPGSPHMLSKKRREVRHSVRRTKTIIDIANHAGALSVNGPVHITHGEKNGRPAIYLVDPLTEIAEYAEAANMPVNVELIRGLETYALNSLTTAVPILRRVKNTYLKIHYDVAHAAIHERDSPADAIERAYDSELLGHVHLGEVDRAPFSRQYRGRIQENLRPIISRLSKLGYKEKATWEGFHFNLWGAVGREDKIEVWSYTKQTKDELASREARESIDILKEAYFS